MRHSVSALTLAVVLTHVAASPATSWFTDGHRIIARAAVEMQPEGVPRFFRRGAGTVAHASGDPDLMKNDAVAALESTEAPEHYLDSELLEGAALPPTRYEYLALLHEMELSPQHVGLLPYSLTEATQRLTMAFAQHRATPESRHIEAKALVYAGIVSHYAGDLGQPLHTTIHHNGRAAEGGSSPMTGFHYRVDPLIEKVQFDHRAALRGARPERLEALMPAIAAEIERSNRLVDRLYELEPLLDRFAESGEADRQVIELVEERFTATTTFLASLFLTAWEDSAEIELPVWDLFDEAPNADDGLPARLVPAKPTGPYRRP